MYSNECYVKKTCLQQMRKDNQQLGLEYKITAPGYRQPHAPIFNNKTTLHNFQTPTWNIALQQQQNHSNSYPQNKTIHNNILQKLDRMKQIDLTHSHFTKVKLPEGFESSRVRVVQKKNENITTPLRQKQKEKDNSQTTIKHNEKSISSKHKHSPLVTRTSLTTSNISNRPHRSGSIIKNKPPPPKLQNETKRFKQITVHEHLYLDGRRMQAKKIMEQVLEEQFRRKYVMTFKPTISAVSQRLAQDKFSRVKERESMERQLEHQIEKLTIESKANKDEVKERRSQNRNKTLNSLFYYLSNNEQLINQKTLKEGIDQLPLVCIRLLQKFIQKVYTGHSYSWLQFIGILNDRKTIKNKAGLLATFQKWQARTLKKQSDNSTKQNTRPY